MPSRHLPSVFDRFRFPPSPRHRIDIELADSICCAIKASMIYIWYDFSPLFLKYLRSRIGFDGETRYKHINAITFISNKHFNVHRIAVCRWTVWLSNLNENDCRFELILMNFASLTHHQFSSCGSHQMPTPSSRKKMKICKFAFHFACSAKCKPPTGTRKKNLSSNMSPG